MKPLTLITIILISSICHGQKVPDENNPKLHPELRVNKRTTDSILGKNITFYLNHKGIDDYSKLFYKGSFVLYDNDETFAFIDSVLTDNNETRPFYFYVFNRVMDMSDGAISEYVAGVCLDYFIKHTCEFYENYNSKEFGVYLPDWTAFLGWQIYTRSKFDILTRSPDKKIDSECPEFQKQWGEMKNEIEKNLEE